MAETVNVGEIAERISKDIFRHFLWSTHPRKNENFHCVNSDHIGEGEKPKSTHPGDVVFYYDDPYLGRRIYLHTDLKSYGKESITRAKLRSAFKSLCMTIECARESEEWRKIYSAPSEAPYEVQGLLFVHNHDHGFEGKFSELIGKTDLSSIPVPANTYVHFLGPEDVAKLYSISNDIIRLKYEKELPELYGFYYPDLVMWRRQGEVWQQPATIETLTAPFFIIKHEPVGDIKAGYLIYYSRAGSSPEEFEYFFDSLSRFQMLEPDVSIRVRVVHRHPDNNFQSNFEAAKHRYAKAWGFDSKREQILSSIPINLITNVTDTYNPGYLGWKE